MSSPGLFILSFFSKNERAWESASSCGSTHRWSFWEEEDLVSVMQRWEKSEFSPLAQRVAMGERSEVVLSVARQSEKYMLWTTFQETLL